MKNTFINILQRQGLRLSFCALAMCFGTAVYAQNESAGEETGIKVPQRRVVDKKNTLVTVSGVVVDDVTKMPVAGVRLHTLGDGRYTAMTNEKGEFTLNLPDFATSLYVQAPRYMSQQVAIKSNDANQKIEVRLLSNKFKRRRPTERENPSDGSL